MSELSPKYNPTDVEQRLYDQWESRGLFHGEPDPSKKPYTIVIPPPNVTGILHMGHALNNTIQDILIRFKRMQGYNALWVPGTDHAGIATQNVVEKALAKEGKRRQNLGRDAFVQRVWEWKEQYGTTIIRQLKRLGSSCDWQRTRFTMDEGLSEAVSEVFLRLYDKGLIYRGNYIIHWCPRCQTALADEEAPRKETHGKLYYIKYPLALGEGLRVKGERSPPPSTLHPSPSFIVVATTRPETMLGDTAIAVHPKDRRYKALVGSHALLPIVNRQLPIIADEVVDREFGTGAVKVTPAHDPADFQLGKTHKLEFINVMTDDGRMTNVPTAYADLDRFECRNKLLHDLDEQGYLVKTEEHVHNVGHCYRCDTIIEPRLSLQWFVRMKKLAEPAIKAVKNKQIVFTPTRWTKVYLNWMENIQDWCISRQIWWGHRLPVYYCDECRRRTAVKGRGSRVKGEISSSTLHPPPSTEPSVIVSKTRPEKCPTCGSTDLKQDEDVLDTWFSSWLWPFSTLGWPRKTKDLDYFYPTNTLVTAPEIIFFWVARMIMAGYFCTGTPPFRQVYIHGTVRDLTGKKMSKSLGNIIDPLDIIGQFGADALRYTLATSTAIGTDVFISEEKFIVGRNFANKLWNATRFLLSLNDEKAAKRPLPQPTELVNEDDQWILSRLQHTIDTVTKELDKFRFHEAASTIYEFLWHDICDCYLELRKKISLSVSSGFDRKQAESSLTILAHALSTSLRLLHPFMPFVTEELWSHLNPEDDSGPIIKAPWPAPDKRYINAKAERNVSNYQTITREVRGFRQKYQLTPSHKVKVMVKTQSESESQAVKQSLLRWSRLGEMELQEVGVEIRRPVFSILIPVDRLEAYIVLEDSVQASKVRDQLTLEIHFFEVQLRGTTDRLSNQGFLSKAPAEVVENERAKQTQLQATLERLKNHLAALS